MSEIKFTCPKCKGNMELMQDEATPYWFCAYCQKRFVRKKKAETETTKTITNGLECLECHDNFIPIRSNQKFCSKDCRYNHNSKIYYLNVRHTQRYKKRHLLSVRNWENTHREKHLAQKRVRNARYRRIKNDKKKKR